MLGSQQSYYKRGKKSESLGQYEQAIEYYHRAIDIDVHSHDTQLIISTLLRIANCHISQIDRHHTADAAFFSACHILNNAIVLFAVQRAKKQGSSLINPRHIAAMVAKLKFDIASFTPKQMAYLIPLFLFRLGLFAYPHGREIVILDAIELSAATKQHISLLNLDGHNPCIVGGTATKHLVARIHGRHIVTNDIDIVSDRHPILIHSELAGSVLFGRERQVVSAKLGDDVFECVAFLPGKGYQNDRAARDTTVNSFYFNLNEQRFYCSRESIVDLLLGRIRIIGDPNKRLAAEPCLMFRIVRDAVRCGFSIEDETKQAMLKYRECAARINSDKRFYLFKKCFNYGCSADILAMLAQYQFLEFFLSFAHADYQPCFEGGNVTDRFQRLLDHFDAEYQQQRAPSLVAVLLYLMEPQFTQKPASLKNGLLKRSIEQTLCQCQSSMRLPENIYQALLMNIMIKFGSHQNAGKQQQPSAEQSYKNTFV